MNKKRNLSKWLVVALSVFAMLFVMVGVSDISTKAADPVQVQAMYRLYNPNSGEHFYTANTKECDNLVRAGWNYEGVAWYAPVEGKPVYRLYNANAGDHHYTLSEKERDSLVSVGWAYEGISWYSDGEVPMQRAYNPNATAGSHHYTASMNEINNLVSVGWKYEGVSWYGCAYTSDMVVINGGYVPPVIVTEEKVETPTPSQNESSNAGSNANQTTPSGTSAGNSAITPDTTGNLVWIPTNGGKKYHSKKSCSGMIDPIQVTVEKAKANGYTACARCH